MRRKTIDDGGPLEGATRAIHRETRTSIFEWPGDNDDPVDPGPTMESGAPLKERCPSTGDRPMVQIGDKFRICKRSPNRPRAVRALVAEELEGEVGGSRNR